MSDSNRVHISCYAVISVIYISVLQARLMAQISGIIEKTKAKVMVIIIIIIIIIIRPGW